MKRHYYNVEYDTRGDLKQNQFLRNQGCFILRAESIEQAIEIVKATLTGFIGDEIVIIKAEQL